MPGPSFSAMARRCGEAKVLEAWRLQFGASSLLGTTGRCAEARSVLHCHAVWMWQSRSFRALAAGRFEAWRIRQSGNKSKKGEKQKQEGRRKRQQEQKDRYFLVGAESDVRHYRPLPGGPFHPSLPCCLSVANRSFRALAAGRFEAWRIRQSGSKSKKARNKSKKAGESGEQKDCYFLVGAESDVRHYRPLPGGPFHPSLPCCLSVANRSFRALAAGRFEAWRIRQPGSKSKKARNKSKKAGESGSKSKKTATFL